MNLLHFLAVIVVFLAQALLQGSQKFFAAPFMADSSFQNLLLKPVGSGVQALLHGIPDLLGEALRLLLNRLQLLREVLAEFILSFTNLLADGVLRRLEQLFRLLAGLLQNLLAEVLAQAYPQFLFNLWRDVRQRDVELAAPWGGFGHLLTKRHDFGLQWLHSLRNQRLHVLILSLHRNLVSSDLRSEEHTSELQSRGHLVCRLLLEKKKHRYS